MNINMTEPDDGYSKQEQDEQQQWVSLTALQQFEVMLKDPKFKAEYERELDKFNRSRQQI